MIDPLMTLNCAGKLLVLEDPVVMGILNVTPDSFHDGGRYNELESALNRAGQLIEEGASIIDVGGMSTRPGSEPVSVAEELRRVLPVIEGIKARYPAAIVSIDTYRTEVARQACRAGASIVNDISGGGMDEGLWDLVATLKVPYILMHIKGRPKDMQKAPEYEQVSLEVLDYFLEKIGKLKALGIEDIVIDPGFGFGKTLEHNYQLLTSLHTLKITGFPIMVGLSRKSMIYRYMETNPEDVLPATSALHLYALRQGAKILRVHDVKEAVQVIQMHQMLKTHESEHWDQL